MALALALAMFLGAESLRAAEKTEALLPALTNAQQVLDYGLPAAATRVRPVRLTAVVTLPMERTRWIYVQDDTAGMLVLYTNAALRLEPGDAVLVNGRTFPGQFAVHVSEADVQVKGRAALPEPKRADPERLADGEDFGRWVALTGRVVDAYKMRNTGILRVASGSRRFFVMGPIREAGVIPAGTNAPAEWIDARIEVRGICWSEVDTRNRPAGFRIHAPGSNYVTVLDPGGADCFAKPVVPIQSLRPGSPPGDPRVKVIGTVTHLIADQWLFLQDETGSVRARILTAMGRTEVNLVFRDRTHMTSLEPGDRVEVVGHAVQVGAALGLTDAEYRRTGQGQPVAPTPATPAALVSGALDNRLVTIKATLVEHQTRGWGARFEEILELQAAGLRFQATLAADRTNTLPHWPPNSRLEIVGVCMMVPGELRAAFTPHLLLRGAGDVTLMRTPRPWESLQPGRILAVSGGLGALALAWIWTLRRRVALRTRELLISNEQLKTEIAERHAAGESLLASEARLRESEERFSKAFHASNAHLAILDAGTGRYLDVNDAFIRAYGYAREAVLGRTSLELGLWEDPKQREEADRRYERDGRLRDFETRMRTRQGDVQVVLQSGDFVSMGDRRCILSVGIDITDRKRAEAELLQNYAREKELSELKSRFVSMVSHEFRTPLAIIGSSAEILENYLDRLSSEERKSNVRDISDATRHMSRMMEEVLLLGRVEAGKLACRPTRLDLAVVGRRLADDVTSTTHGRCPIQFSATPGLPEAQADEGLLRHIFTNLLNNASKYSAPGGAVEFRVEARGSLAVFTVRDRGIGIPEADAPLLFQAFHRGGNAGDTPGTGLGMTIVKRCVELHGGKIAFESKEGRGTTFVVALPVFGSDEGNGNGNGEGMAELFRAVIGGQEFIVIPCREPSDP